MASTKTTLRTAKELKRARWAEKYLSVAEGKQYTQDGNSPFPLHPYFKNKLLGPQVKMLEVNAGLCIVENMTADTLTDLKMTIEGDESGDSKLEQEFREWQEATEYAEGLEESVRNWFGVGYSVRQPIRTVEGTENGMTVVNVDPASWYPDIPALLHQKVTSGRIICVFDKGKDGQREWYALVEKHTIGQVAYELYRLEGPDSIEGAAEKLTKFPEFAELKAGATDLDTLAVFQRNRKRKSKMVCGRSVLADVWDMLQEVTENQTRIRHECIKHHKAKMYAELSSLQQTKAAGDKDPNQMNSKELALAGLTGRHADGNQEIFPVKAGGVVPGYIQRDLQFIVLGSVEIDKLLSRIASVVGCPKGIFNLDEPGGNVHVDTEKRKDRRYVRQILQAQAQAALMVRQDFEVWCKWVKGIEPPKATFSFTSPFAMSQLEVVELMREMNPSATFVSQEEAVRQIFADKKPEEIEKMLKQIKDDQEAEMPPMNALDKLRPVTV